MPERDLTAIQRRMAQVAVEPWSYTRLSSYEECPRKWFEQYVMKIKSPPTEATVLGSAVHEVLEWYATRATLGERPDDFSLRQKAQQVVEAYAAEAPDLVSEYTTGTAIQLARAGVRRLPATLSGARVEQTSKARLSEAATIQGKIDLEFEDGETIVVRDYKTGRAKYDVDGTHQLGLYGALVMSQPRAAKRKVRVELHFLRTDEVFAREADADLLKTSALWAATLVDQIRQRLLAGDPAAFEATPGHLCAYCHVADTCPVAQAAKAIPAEGAVTQLAEAQEIAQSVLALEAHAKALMARLKGYVDAHGGFVVGGEEFGYAVSTSRTVKKLSEFHDALQKAGKDPWGFFQTKSRAVKDLFEAGDVPEALKALVRESQRRNFGHRAEGGGEE